MTVLAGSIESTGTAIGRTTIQHSLHRLFFIVAMADTLALVASVILAWNARLAVHVWAQEVSPNQSLAATFGPWIVLLWIIVLAAHGAYSIRVFGAGSQEFAKVLRSSALTAGTVGLTCYLLKYDLSRGFVLLTFLIGCPLLLSERYALRKTLHGLRARGHLRHRVVAVGEPSGIHELVDVLSREQYTGYEVVAACVPTGMSTSDDFPVPVAGSVPEARPVCEQFGADTVLVTRGGYATAADLRRIAWDLDESGIDLIVVPSLTDVAGPRIYMRPVAGLPLLHVEGPQADAAGGWAKRIFDVVGSLLLLLLLSPFLIMTAVAVKLHDGGPVLFRQPRVGRDGEIFSMLKIRSMVPDAEARMASVAHMNESDAVLFKIRTDPRVTPVGRFLRKYSLDELPQLINVLQGHMSLVGPRPPLSSEVEAYNSDDLRRLLVRPGMTGLWQVSGRSELSWKEAVRLDLYYVDNWSMLTDLVIMGKTLRAVLTSSGAY